MQKSKLEHRKLGEVCEIIMGQSPPSSTYNQEGEGMPFFQGKAEFGDRYPTVKKWCTQPSKKAKKNDILMSVRAPVGPVNLADKDCAIGRGLCAFRAKTDVDYLYVYFFLKHTGERIAEQGSGSTFKAINKKQVESIEIPVPPLPMQKQIVSILEKLEGIRNKQKQSMQQTNTLFDAFLQSAFNGTLVEEK